MQNNRSAWLWLAIVAVLFVGCGKKEKDSANAEPQVDGSKYLLPAEPEGAQSVKDVLKNAQNGDPVVVVGRIGGQTDPWTEGEATFLIADVSLVPCNEIEGDNCLAPWDYCCEAELKTSHTMVEVVDENGEVVPCGAKKLLQVKELQTVVVEGKVSRDEAGSFSLLATGIFVRS